ncbi:MAG: Phenolphthiocerol synthesis polyketide synthase type I Pks15/1 [Calditrichaeota bacterium]|nr:Phenolphthiocerol synthesis polyketide synthase type I Pks15/1 [Calditrichota bacterium]
MPERQASDIAIVGLGSLFPGARTTREFWRNIVSKLDVLSEIPRERWDWRLYYDSDRRARDRSYSRWGGFMPEIPFNPLDYGIPPNSLRSIDPIQLLTLEVVREALADAGYLEKEFDRENTSVIIGSTLAHGEMGQKLIARSELPQAIPEIPDDAWDRLPEWSEESMVGYLLNVLAGRVANRFDFGGTNQLVDAACASSLSSVAAGAYELIAGDANVAVAGGVDANQSAFNYVGFSKTTALTPDDRARPFDRRANGILLGEGVGVVILRRLDDAIRDGDSIYAVLKGFGSSSDGRARSLFTPYPAGQARALKRAYTRAGVSISTLDLVVTHGTGTVAGDRAEVETMIDFLRSENAEPNSVLIHSNKAQIGHTKASAGIASLIEAALALQRRVLPPQMYVEQPQPVITDESTPVCLADEALPWFRHPDHPRRAGVSAFGFGGTNFHAVLEEAPDEHRAPIDAEYEWPCELVVLRGRDRAALKEQAENLLAAFEQGAEPRLCDLAYSTILRAWNRRELPATAAIAVRDRDHLTRTLKRLLPHLDGGVEYPVDPNVTLHDEQRANGEPVALLFPGHGSQYIRQGREIVAAIPEMREAVEWADRRLRGRFPQRFSRYLYPPSLYDEEAEERQNELFANVHYSMLALVIFHAGMSDLLARLKLTPAIAAGHSLGEPSAIAYGGAIGRDQWLDAVERRMRRMDEHAREHPSNLLAVNITRDIARARAKKYPNLQLANQNAHEQTVIGGPAEETAALREELVAEGIRTYRIPLDGAYHTSVFEPLRDELTAIVSDYHVSGEWKLPVYDNRTGGVIPADESEIRDRLANHLLHPAEWVTLIESMYDAGARVFLETGPKSVLTNLHEHVLGDKPYHAVSLDDESGELRTFLLALGKLAGLGVEFDLPALYQHRNVRELDLDNLVETTKPEPLKPTTWFVTGGTARPMSQQVGRLGAAPPLNLESRELLRAAGGTKRDAEEASERRDVSPGTNDDEPPEPPAFPPDADPNEVMAEYQRRMQKYLERQEQAMQEYIRSVNNRHRGE